MKPNGIGLALVAEARRLGLSLRADGDTIKVKPADRLPLGLANRIKANRAEVLAVLRSLPNADRPGCPATHANEADGQTDGGKRPVADVAPIPLSDTRFSFPPPFDARLFLEHVATRDDPLPVRWVLDDLDRRALLACGILPTPSPDELPEPWKSGYRTHGARLAKMGVLAEHAERIAFQEALRRMLAAGELAKEGW